MGQYRNPAGSANPLDNCCQISPLLFNVSRFASAQILFKGLSNIGDCANRDQMLGKVWAANLASSCLLYTSPSPRD